MPNRPVDQQCPHDSRDGDEGLLRQGVKDMVRISDARMSGTAYGCCVLHVAPESWVGGPLALVRTGDTIELETEGLGKLTVKVRDELKRTWARETRLDREQKGLEGTTPQLTGKYADQSAKKPSA